MFTYEDFENAIVQQLSGRPNCDVVSMPENDAAYKLPFIRPKITVAYAGSRFGKTKQIGSISQEEHQLYELIIQARQLRGTNGIYSIIDYVKKRILGFETGNSKKMYIDEGMDRIGFVAREDQVFTYRIVVVAETMFVQQIGLPEFDGPPITEIGFNSNLQ